MKLQAGMVAVRCTSTNFCSVQLQQSSSYHKLQPDQDVLGIRQDIFLVISLFPLLQILISLHQVQHLGSDGNGFFSSKATYSVERNARKIFVCTKIGPLVCIKQAKQEHHRFSQGVSESDVVNNLNCMYLVMSCYCIARRCRKDVEIKKNLEELEQLILMMFE